MNSVLPQTFRGYFSLPCAAFANDGDHSAHQIDRGGARCRCLVGNGNFRPIAAGEVSYRGLCASLIVSQELLFALGLSILYIAQYREKDLVGQKRLFIHAP